MWRRLPDRHETALAVVAPLVVSLLGLSVATVDSGPLWHRGESVSGAVMTALVVLLLLKVAVIFVSIRGRLLLSPRE
jgi:hypothetical protein